MFFVTVAIGIVLDTAHSDWLKNQSIETLNHIKVCFAVLLLRVCYRYPEKY